MEELEGILEESGKFKMGLALEKEENWERFYKIARDKKDKITLSERGNIKEENPQGYEFLNKVVNFLSFFQRTEPKKREDVVLRLSGSSKKYQLSKILPSIRNQIFDDCVVNAIASAIEYITTPIEEDPAGLLPLKISRVGLYNESIRASYYPTLTDWKENWNEVGKNDMGVTLGNALITLDKYGAFPEMDLKVTDSFSVSGWGYDESFKRLPIPQEMFLLAMDEDFDGVNEHNQQALIDGSYLLKKEVCCVPNPYAKVARNFLYEPIEPPKKREYTSEFYDKIKKFISEDKPIAIGIGVTSSFKYSKQKFISSCSADSFLGPHAILVLGYGDYGSGDCFYVQNSWGSSWGNGGRAYISKEYFEKYFYGGFALSIPGFFD
jgi:hypothetical protein